MKTHRSGWCQSASDDRVALDDARRAELHNQCGLATLSSDATLTVCDCDCHDGVPYCSTCGYTHPGEDHAPSDCEAHIVGVLADRENHLVSIDWKKVSRTLGVDGGVTAPSRTPSATKRPSRAATGTCACGCGDPTGGTFAMGHDAKLKAALRKAALDGDAQAHAEILARGWAKSAGSLDDAPYRSRMEAEAMVAGYDDDRIEEWVRSRDEGRRAQEVTP